MLWSLKTLNRLFDNFGISIIALTILVRILFWPLNKKAYLSTLKMKEIQPELERIRKKFDTKDRAQVEQMNREIFALYKNKKVNPLGGCLPMLLQLPIFIGLYGALSHSIDLYQAPFFGWLQDLSLPDPYYIFPIIWTLSLLGYLAVNPQAMNTNQPGMPNMKWIMIGMNLFFGFLSKDWPAGLLVYLVVSNCVGLSQQYFLMRSNTKPQLLREGA
jgi:YidC/Oxa1 family membrane protein insertase